MRAVYKAKSNNKSVIGKFTENQPVVLKGKGKIVFGKDVNFGVVNSPLFYNSYAYIEARNKDSVVTFGNNIKINNSISLVAEKSITVEDDVLIGYNCSIMDSDFHDLSPLQRSSGKHIASSVTICKNVFIGNNVTILKGVTIGENSVVAASSTVTKTFPSNVIIAGNPANIVREL